MKLTHGRKFENEMKRNNLSPLLFNLYLNTISRILDNSHGTNPIILPNGFPVMVRYSMHTI